MIDYRPMTAEGPRPDHSYVDIEGQRKLDPITEFRSKQVITAESLIQDNHSSKAKERRESHKSHKKRVIGECSDARMYLSGLHAVFIPSLGASGPYAPFERVFYQDSMELSAIHPHFAAKPDSPEELPEEDPSGQKLYFAYLPGVPLVGCGAQGVKEQLVKNGGNTNPEGALAYVDKNVSHSDTIFQAMKKTIEIGMHTSLPILAAAQNHLSGELHVVAYSLNGGRFMGSEIPIPHVIGNKYDVNEVYGERPPFIPNGKVPDEFQPYLTEHRQQLKKLYAKVAAWGFTLAELQRVQNPRVVLISNHMAPAEVRYPKTTEIPGSVFRISVAEDVTGSISKGLPHTVDQADYAFSHSNGATNESSQFGLTTTTIIDMDSMEKCEETARALLASRSGKQWHKRDETQLILIKSPKGVIEDPEKDLVVVSKAA